MVGSGVENARIPLPVTSRACDRWERGVASVASVACKLKPSVRRLDTPGGLPLSAPVLGSQSGTDRAVGSDRGLGVATSG